MSTDARDLFQRRALSPERSQHVAAAMSAGVHPKTLAAQYGVSVRTIYRAAIYGRSRWERVTIAGWSAEFVITADGPVRCTPWWPA